jgi:hypothetical protein
MAELVLNNFASAIIHSAVFPQYPVRGVEETIRFHLRPEPRPKGFPHGKLRPIPACRPGPNLAEERPTTRGTERQKATMKAER